MFDELLTDKVTIRTRDGRVFTDIAASVQTSKIFIQRSDIPIQPGDEVVRRTPAGVDEVFLVDDPGFQAEFHGIPAGYRMRVRRADRPAVARTGPSIIYNVTGPNARFNINSSDNSTNVINESPAAMFRELREVIAKQVVSEPERDALIAHALALESEVGKASFATRYAQFMALAANHVEALGPFIPALTQFLVVKLGV